MVSSKARMEMSCDMFTDYIISSIQSSEIDSGLL
jgi:hypothetical protein